MSGPESPRERQLTGAGSAGRMALLVDDLTDATRITRGEVRLQAARLDLAQLVHDTAEGYRRSLEQAGLTLVVTLPDTLAWVEGDRDRLAQVVGNLLDNAAKFTGRGGEVRVVVRRDEAGRRAVLSVRDTGAGIAPELLPDVFDLFPRGGGAGRGPTGLGLGLAVVKGLAALHGGEVRAVSGGPGRGAEFTVSLPLAAEPAALAGETVPPRRSGRRLRVLVVEDNRDGADTLRVLLEHLGHEVRVAHTGPDGVRAAGEWGPQVVVCDIGLPGLDGFGVARELRRAPATAGAVLVAVTALAGDEVRRRARGSGFDYLLTKPADPSALLQLLSISA